MVVWVQPAGNVNLEPSTHEEFEAPEYATIPEAAEHELSTAKVGSWGWNT